MRVVATSIGNPLKMPLRIADTLYRIGQEAIANAVAHGHPSTIVIQVAYEKGRVSISIEDDGQGFVPSEDLHGFGVRGMGKRAASILAKLEVQSRPGEGTRVSVVALLPARAALTSWSALLQANVWRHIRSVTDSR